MKRSTATKRVATPIQACSKESAPESDAQRLLPGYKTARCASVQE
jgi:hypothetical protein